MCYNKKKGHEVNSNGNTLDLQKENVYWFYIASIFKHKSF